MMTARHSVSFGFYLPLQLGLWPSHWYRSEFFFDKTAQPFASLFNFLRCPKILSFPPRRQLGIRPPLVSCNFRFLFSCGLGLRHCDSSIFSGQRLLIPLPHGSSVFNLLIQTPSVLDLFPPWQLRLWPPYTVLGFSLPWRLVLQSLSVM